MQIRERFNVMDDNIISREEFEDRDGETAVRPRASARSGSITGLLFPSWRRENSDAFSVGR
jgi:hypothetical protein